MSLLLFIVVLLLILAVSGYGAIALSPVLWVLVAVVLLLAVLGPWHPRGPYW